MKNDRSKQSKLNETLQDRPPSWVLRYKRMSVMFGLISIKGLLGVILFSQVNLADLNNDEERRWKAMANKQKTLERLCVRMDSSR